MNIEIEKIIKLKSGDRFFLKALMELGISTIDELISLDTTELSIKVKEEIGNMDLEKLDRIKNILIFQVHLARYYFADEDYSVVGINGLIAEEKIKVEEFTSQAKKELKKSKFSTFGDLLKCDAETLLSYFTLETIFELYNYVHQFGGLFLDEYLNQISPDLLTPTSKKLEKYLKLTMKQRKLVERKKQIKIRRKILTRELKKKSKIDKR